MTFAFMDFTVSRKNVTIHQRTPQMSVGTANLSARGENGESERGEGRKAACERSRGARKWR